MEHNLLKLQMYYHWNMILRLRRKGVRRMARGVSWQDEKLRRWSDRITDRGLRVRHLERQYLTSHVDKSGC